MTEEHLDLLDHSGQAGVAELRGALLYVLGGGVPPASILGQQRLKSRVFRLRVQTDGGTRSLIVKRLDPATARRNQLVAERWLPLMGLGDVAPAVLGVAADRNGRWSWHIHEDLGDWNLKGENDPARVKVALEAIGRLHTLAAEHPLLPECRRQGGDLGIHYFASNLRDAVRGLAALQPPHVDLSAERADLRDRLLARLHRLLDDQPRRAQALEEFGGPETLLHGDLWTTNTFVVPTPDGLRAKLIDWDHAGVGPVSYDLSTFLYRFPAGLRPWMLDCYREAVRKAGWRLPGRSELNLLFDTAECARYANRVIWPVMAFLQERADWAFAELTEVDGWFEALEPVLPA